VIDLFYNESIIIHSNNNKNKAGKIFLNNSTADLKEWYAINNIPPKKRKLMMANIRLVIF